MKKVVAAMGSPRQGGNTDILVSKIADGARLAGASVDVLNLGQLKIHECIGCQRCWKRGKCRWDDDMQSAYAMIGQSDALVFATPVYWYGPSALMKAYLDRFVYFNCDQNRPKIKGKRAIVAVVMEEEDAKGADLVLEMFRRSIAYLAMDLAGEIVVPGVGPKGAIRAKPEFLERAVEIGRSVAVQDGINGLR